MELDEDALKNITREGDPELGTEEERFYARVLRILNLTQIPYVVGAAFARHAYTGIWRKTKDLDVFIRAQDLRSALEILQRAGYRTEIEFDSWLAKAFDGDYFTDFIFGTGHGQLVVDDAWFDRARPGEVLGVRTRLASFEDMISVAAFVAERSRFDAADILHLIKVSEGKIDWQHVLKLLNGNWELLLWHLILFDYVYPGHPGYLPQELMGDLFTRVQQRWKEKGGNPKAFRGTIIDPFSFTVDVEDWGYEDRRKLKPLVNEKGEVV